MEQLSGSKLENEYDKAVSCHPAINSYAEYIWASLVAQW